LRLFVDAPRERDHLSAPTPSALAGNLEYRAEPGEPIVTLAIWKPLKLGIDHDETIPSSLTTRRLPLARSSSARRVAVNAQIVSRSLDLCVASSVDPTAELSGAVGTAVLTAPTASRGRTIDSAA
jgi:hypothetical protein